MGVANIQVQQNTNGVQVKVKGHIHGPKGKKLEHTFNTQIDKLDFLTDNEIEKIEGGNPCDIDNVILCKLGYPKGATIILPSSPTWRMRRVVEVLESMDYEQSSHNKALDMIYTHLLQVDMALRLNLTFVDAEGYDAIAPSGKLIEFKACARSTRITSKTKKDGKSRFITVNNLTDKEDTILYVVPGVFDMDEHWFWFPKGVIENAKCPVKGTSLLWYGKSSPKGKMILPTKYKGDKRDSWRKKFLRDHEVTLEQLKELVK